MIKQMLATTVFAAGVLLGGAAMAQTQAPVQDQGMVGAPAWHESSHGMQIGNEYTNALNTLYAHGFHGVQHLSLQDGTVQALAVTPNGRVRHVSVVPGSGQVQMG